MLYKFIWNSRTSANAYGRSEALPLMKNKFKNSIIVANLAGMAVGFSVLFFVYILFYSSSDSAIPSNQTFNHPVYRAVESSDWLGLAGVGAAKATDKYADVVLAYGLSAACENPKAIQYFESKQGALHLAAIQHNRSKDFLRPVMENVQDFALICNGGWKLSGATTRDNLYLLTKSPDARSLFSENGVNSYFVGLAESDWRAGTVPQ